MGFLSQVRVKGKQYIYLSEYIGQKKFTTKSDIHVYGFGERTKALERMKKWQRGEEELPKEIRKRGYDLDDLAQWIQTLETGVSPTGRSKKFS